MSSLEDYKQKIRDLSSAKGWNRDKVWLAYSLFKEVGELVNAIEHNEPPENLGGEFADIEHFLFQLMQEASPGLDLDKALQNKIISNYHDKKKTYNEGEFVRK